MRIIRRYYRFTGMKDKEIGPVSRGIIDVCSRQKSYYCTIDLDGIFPAGPEGAQNNADNRGFGCAGGHAQML